LGMTMTTMETDRLTIRNFSVNDWEALREMILQYQASEYAAYDHPWPTAPDEIRKAAEWFAGGDSYLVVCLKDTGRFIGFVCLNPEEHGGESALNIGYIFNFDYHGRGYATEACRAALARAFDELGAARVVTGTAKANLPSCRLLKRLGLKETGEGMFAISRDEWRRQNGIASG